jgi:hypothetical protein
MKLALPATKYFVVWGKMHPAMIVAVARRTDLLEPRFWIPSLFPTLS